MLRNSFQHHECPRAVGTSEFLGDFVDLTPKGTNLLPMVTATTGPGLSGRESARAFRAEKVQPLSAKAFAADIQDNRESPQAAPQGARFNHGRRARERGAQATVTLPASGQRPPPAVEEQA